MDVATDETILLDDLLLKCFSTIYQNSSCEISAVEARLILDELNIECSDVRKTEVLLEMLPFYINNWPGWKRVKKNSNNESLAVDGCFERFRQFLIFKLKCAMNFDVELKAQCKRDATAIQIKDAETQTDPKAIAPFTINVSGPPSVISSLVFIANNDNLVIKQHSLNPWKELNLFEVLNCPSVSVQLNLPDISLVRQCELENNGFITTKEDKIEASGSFIKSIIETSPEHEKFHYQDLRNFKCEFFKILTSRPYIFGQYLNRVREIIIVLEQFLLDVKELNLHNMTIATNAKISFDISKNYVYVRSKKRINQTAEKTVTYYEVIVPRIQLTLNHFKLFGESLLKKLQTPSEESVKEFCFSLFNCLQFGCIMCKKQFGGINSFDKLIDHFKTEHFDEQPVVCNSCKTSIHIKTLLETRWKHSCESTRS